MDSAWPLLLTALVGILSGAIVPLILQWRSKGAEASKLEIEYKDIEDQITERVLERAKSHIDSLVVENLDLRTQLDTVKKEKEGLVKRVNILEEKYLVMQEEHADLLVTVNTLREGICLLCEQLNEVGVEPAFVIEDSNGRD